MIGEEEKTMDEKFNQETDIALRIQDNSDHPTILKIAYALSVPERLKILQCILSRSVTLAQIQKELDLPMTSISRHVNILAEAGLIYVHYTPGIKGHRKFCSQAITNLAFFMENTAAPTDRKVSFEMPVGMFSSCHISAPCGMNSATQKLIPYDDPSMFFLPQRREAELLWFAKGFVCYHFPVPHLHGGNYRELEFSLELCSEAAYYNNNWPSDITFYVNDEELTTYTSPGDFGGRRGLNTPMFWPTTSTQYGLFTVLRINGDGVFLNDQLQTDRVNIDSLRLGERDCIKFKIGIKDDAEHCGGINLFGRNFGDFPQAIKMTVQ